MSVFQNLLERLFCIHARGSTLSRELLGGATHFMGNVYNLVATASVLHVGGLSFVEGIVGGAWVMCVSQVIVGFWSNLPISVSAGAGPNLTVAYLLAQSVAKGGLGSYEGALTCCMISGVLITLLTALGVISIITNLVPTSLKLAIGVGIGLLLAFVGFQQVDMVVRNEEGLIGPGSFFSSPEIWFSLGGLMLLTLLNARRVRGAVLLTMLVLTVLDWSICSGWPDLKFDSVQLPTVFIPDLQLLRLPSFWVQVLALVLMLVFDAMGCVFGLSKLAGLMDLNTGQVPGGKGMFQAVGVSTTAAALFGLSPIVVSGASAAAIAEGARTGLSTCFSGLLSLTALPLSSTLAAMPACTSSFVLIYVGVSMSADAADIAWADPIAAVPAFLCIICQPFLFSIADGICMGLTAWIVLSVFSGRAFSATREFSIPDSQMVPDISPRANSLQLPSDGFTHANFLPYNGLPRRVNSLGSKPFLNPSDPFGEGIWSV